MKTYTNSNGINIAILDLEDVHNYAHEKAQEKASELGEYITELYLNNDTVEIHGIEKEENLKLIEEDYYKYFYEAESSINNLK